MAQGAAFQLLLLAIAVCAVSYARFALSPLQEAMRVDLGLSDNQMAWLQGPALAVPTALGAIPLGLVIDRWRRAPLFVLFIVLIVVANVLTAFASRLSLVFFCRCLSGLALPAIGVAAYSMVADLYPAEQRGRANMVVVIGEFTGGPAAFAFGGLLLSMSAYIASPELPGGWRWALLWMCAPLLPIVILMLALREPPRTGVIVKNPPLGKVWLELWEYRGVVLPLFLARVMVWIADGAVLVWGAPTFSRRFGLPASRVGAIMASTLLISGMVSPLLGGFLADFCQRSGGPRRTTSVLAVLALMSAPAALFALMPNAILAGILLGLFLTLGFMIGTAAITLGTVVIPGELRGLYIAVTVTGAAVFSVGVAPLVVSGVSGALGGPAAIGEALAIVCGATSLLGAAVFMFGRRYFPPAVAISASNH